MTGADYDAFVGEFIEAAVDKYGKSVMLQVISEKGHACQRAIRENSMKIDFDVGMLYPLRDGIDGMYRGGRNNDSCAHGLSKRRCQNKTSYESSWPVKHDEKKNATLC